MSNSLLDTFLHYGTAAQRAAFVPDPPVVGGVPVQVLYEWRETDTGDTYVYDTAWHKIAGSGLAVTSVTGTAPIASSGGATPAISLNASGVTAASYGDATHVPQIAVDATGRVTSATNVAIPSGAGGVTSVSGTAPIASSGGATPAISLNASGVTAATYGDATHVAQVAVDVTGRVTSASNVAITGGGGGAGALVYLASLTASASASLDLTTRNQGSFSGALFQSDYDDYLIELVHLIPTATNTLMMRVSTNGGSTWDATSNYYTFYLIVDNTFATSSTGGAAGTLWPLTGTVEATQTGVSGSLKLHGPQQSAIDRTMLLDLFVHRTSVLQRETGGAVWVNTTAINAVQLFYNGTTMASGTARVYGYAK